MTTKFISWGGRLTLLLILAAVTLLPGTNFSRPEKTQALSTDLVISQVYGAGGNAGATYTNDFVEIFNRGTTTVTLTGTYSIQYTSAAGTGLFSANVTPLTGSVAPGQYFLVQMSGGANGIALPTADATGTTAMAAGAGKVILANVQTGIACNGSSTACSGAQTAQIVDLVGYGTTANYFEGAAAPVPNTTTSIVRAGGGCTETDNNSSDFATSSPPIPRNTTSPFNICGVAPTVTGSTPAPLATGVATNATVTIDFSEAVNITTGGITIECPDNVTPITFTGLPVTRTDPVVLTPTGGLPSNTVCTVEVLAANLSDYQGATLSANHTFTFTMVTVDTPPTASVSTPAAITNVPVGTNIVVDFNEAVDISNLAAPDAFTLTCGASVAFGLSVTLPATNVTQVTVDPTNPLPYNTGCTLTVAATRVNDTDTNDAVADFMTADYIFTFTTEVDPVTLCGTAFTAIYQIQGSNPAPAITGAVTTEGVVVGDYEGAAPTLRGFYIQDGKGGDADVTTSDGIFVFNGSNNNVNLGDHVRVTGTAADFQDQTQISAVTTLTICNTGQSVAATPITLPLSAATDWERYEGMFVTFPQTMSVTEIFLLGRFGEVLLSQGGRLDNFTAVNPPSGAGYTAHLDEVARRSIKLDDALNNQNADPIFLPQPSGLSALNTLRGGYTITNLTGILSYTWGGNSASPNSYRVRPVTGQNYSFVAANPRPVAPPAVGGRIQVASSNVLNYFITLDTNPGSNNGPNICGPALSQECRGASTALELTRQTDKLVQALTSNGAEVIGIMEIENDPGNATLQYLVDQLNAVAGAGTYNFIATGPQGTDAIRVALIYKPSAVTPVGTFEVIDQATYPLFDVSRNRPALAQVFEEVGTGERFIVVVNHLKSKGSGCGAGDDDTTTGQGNCNLTRTRAAQALADWIANDPYFDADPDVLIIGDLNSYALEDPITTLIGAGYTNLIGVGGGYSYVFDGQWGYLDHALANATMAAQVTGVADWHINSDEPSVLDYNTDFKSVGQVSSLYNADFYRTSDHDQVIIGLFQTVVTTPPTLPGNSGDTPAAEVAQGRPFRDSDFVIKFVDKSLAQIGDTLTYTITFSNPKGVTLRQVVISDPLDSRLSNVRVVSTSQGTATVNGNTVTVQNLEMLPGQRVTLVITAVISDRVRPGDKIVNIATLESPDASIHVSNATETLIIPGALPATGERDRDVLPFLLLIGGGVALAWIVLRRKFA